jgi:Xaa-Pro aminopeptidase
LNESPLRAKDTDGVEHRMGHFFITGVGHQVGLDVHDVGGYARPLAEGQVFTIEPGLYIPSESLGIRIEDMYHLTPTGLVKLSGEIPSAPEDVEAWMARARAEAAPRAGDH